MDTLRLEILCYLLAIIAPPLIILAVLAWWLERNQPKHERGSEFQTRIMRAKRDSWK